MSLRQRSDDRGDNRRSGRHGNAAGNLRGLIIGNLLLLRVLRDPRLIIIVLGLALLLVNEQAAGMAVRSAADLARVRLLARVRKSVLLQVLQSTERLTAGLAVIIRFAGVRGDVGLEGARLSERGAAILTDERPVARVSPFVIDAVRVGREAAAAVLAYVRLVAGVRSHVEHEAGVLPERLAAYVAEEALEVRVLLLLGALVNSQMLVQLHLLLERLVTLLAGVRLRLLVALLLILVRAATLGAAVHAALVLPAVHIHLMLQQGLLRVVRFPADSAREALALVIGIQLLSYPGVYQFDGRFVVGRFLRLRAHLGLVVTVPIHVALEPVLSEEFHVTNVTDVLLLVVYQQMTLKRPFGAITLAAVLAAEERRVVERLGLIVARVAVYQIRVPLFHLHVVTFSQLSRRAVAFTV